MENHERNVTAFWLVLGALTAVVVVPGGLHPERPAPAGHLAFGQGVHFCREPCWPGWRCGWLWSR